MQRKNQIKTRNSYNNSTLGNGSVIQQLVNIGGSAIFPVAYTGPTPTSPAIQLNSTGDAGTRWLLNVRGDQTFGDGTGSTANLVTLAYKGSDRELQLRDNTGSVLGTLALGKVNLTTQTTDATRVIEIAKPSDTSRRIFLTAGGKLGLGTGTTTAVQVMGNGGTYSYIANNESDETGGELRVDDFRGRLSYTGSLTSSPFISTNITGDSLPRFSVTAGGSLGFTNGSSAIFGSQGYLTKSSTSGALQIGFTNGARDGTLLLQTISGPGASNALTLQNLSGTVRVDGSSFTVDAPVNTTAGNLVLNPTGIAVDFSGKYIINAILPSTNLEFPIDYRTNGAVGNFLITRLSADAQDRFRVSNEGQVSFGGGTSAPDCWIDRQNTTTLRISNSALGFGRGTLRLDTALANTISTNTFGYLNIASSGSTNGGGSNVAISSTGANFSGGGSRCTSIGSGNVAFGGGNNCSSVSSGSASYASGSYNTSISNVDCTFGSGSNNVAFGNLNATFGSGNYSTIIGSNSGSITSSGNFNMIVNGTSTSISSSTGNAVFNGGPSTIINSSSNANFVVGAARTISACSSCIFLGGQRSGSSNSGNIIMTCNDATIVGAPGVSRNLEARMTGGYWFATNSSNTTGAQMTSGSSSWSAISDVRSKKIHSVISGRGANTTAKMTSILDALDTYELYSYNYLDGSADDPIVLGPTTESFYGSFGQILGKKAQTRTYTGAFDEEGNCVSKCFKPGDEIELLDERDEKTAMWLTIKALNAELKETKTENYNLRHAAENLHDEIDRLKIEQTSMQSRYDSLADETRKLREGLTNVISVLRGTKEKK